MGAASAHPKRDKGVLQKKEKENQILSGKSGQYQVEKLLGQGGYGKVVQCIKLDTMEKMAVKVVKKDLYHAGRREVNMLKKLRQLDQDKNNLVRFTEHFEHRGFVCLAFEVLDLSLFDFMANRGFKPLNLSEIRAITQQMLVALNALKNIGLVHADIKPDNVMLVNHQLQPFKLKLIDFGMALPVTSLKSGRIIQTLGYRAPEVILGLPLNEAVDMWGLGCVLAFMYVSNHLYSINCEYEVMRLIVQMQGQPDDQMLDSGINTRDFFKKDQDSSNTSWRLKTKVEYMYTMGCVIYQEKGIFDKLTSIDDIAKTRPEVTDALESEDTRAFLSLLKRMLHVDPKQRITPNKALGHRFITMKHFSSNANPSPYLSSACSIIKESQLEESSVERFITSSEVVSLKGSYLTTPTADLDEASTMGPNYRSPQNSHSSTDDGTTGFIEIKTRRTFLKKIHKFFSKMLQSVCPRKAGSTSTCST